MGADSGDPAGAAAPAAGHGVMESPYRDRRPYRNYGLGRRPAVDERDLGYSVAPRLAAVETLPDYRYWTPGPVLDQGSTPTCVGHAWRQFLTASPVRTKAGPTPIEIYDEAQRVDEWPGEGYAGTSVRAGAKVLQGRGHLREYLWARTADEVLRWLLTRGAVVLGTVWRTGMFEPDAEGFIWPTGSVAGGHAYAVIGANRERGVVRIVNSWGTGWGERGRAWMALETLEQLIREDGEACTTDEVAA